LVLQNIIILALLSKIVYDYRGKITFVVQENTGLIQTSVRPKFGTAKEF
jgi:hypothetical protein